MRTKLLLLALVLALILAAVVAAAVLPAQSAKPASVTAAVKALPMFGGGKWETHYRAPNDAQIDALLEKAGIRLNGARRVQAESAFRAEWAERNPTTPNPKKFAKLIRRERKGDPTTVTGSSFMSLAVPVEFPATDTFDAWVTDADGNRVYKSITTTGPLHNEVPAPGPRDNNTIWYKDTTPQLYSELYFGVGPKAGVIVQHPNLGAVDLRGNTMANYYLEQSEGKYLPKGEVYPRWLEAAHSEAWYGADNEDSTNYNLRAEDLVREVVDGINADDAEFPWQQYDGNGDGVVDNFTVIHAGMGQEGGGGQQGDLAIWSHASTLDAPTGYLACKAGTHGATRDIYVREYSMDPEHIDIGVIAEEYGHAAFGLPDIYTTDYDASGADWAIMEAGSWNGPLGGMQPAPFPLYFRYLVGWANPVEVPYDKAGVTTAKVGQLSLRPKNTQQGVKIDLPDQVIATDNPMGTGKAWWSDRADSADFTLAHDFDLTGATAPVFSFASSWSMEKDYDYSYVEASADGGTTWTKLKDTTGFMVDDGSGNFALNDVGEGTLSFDLAAYAGKQITLRLHYTSDVGVQWAGWFADSFSLKDGATTLFSDDCENPPNGWTTNHWVIVPLTRTFPMYYLAEWRNDSGFDRGLKYAYNTVYNDPNTNEWQVDRAPYTVPGMLLWLRNGAYDFDYTLGDAAYDPPSYGPKHALLVVDSHYWPLEWNGMGTSGVARRVGDRLQSGNAAFTLQPTTPFTLNRPTSTATGIIAETKTFSPLPPVSQFHDSLGYYPGLRYHFDEVTPDNEGLYFWNFAASAVVPAQAPYTTRITWDDKSPATDLYGADLGDTVLGSGDPRDDGVQYGVNLAVLQKAQNGEWGKIAFWNATSLARLDMKASLANAKPGQLVQYDLKVANLGPAPQPFTVADVIPAGMSYVSGGSFDAASGTATWQGTVSADQVKVLHLTLMVTKGTASGVTIKNIAVLQDDADGDSASASVTVK